MGNLSDGYRFKKCGNDWRYCCENDADCENCPLGNYWTSNSTESEIDKLRRENEWLSRRCSELETQMRHMVASAANDAVCGGCEWRDE